MIILTSKCSRYKNRGKASYSPNKRGISNEPIVTSYIIMVGISPSVDCNPENDENLYRNELCESAIRRVEDRDPQTNSPGRLNPDLPIEMLTVLQERKLLHLKLVCNCLSFSESNEKLTIIVITFNKLSQYSSYPFIQQKCHSGL